MLHMIVVLALIAPGLPAPRAEPTPVARIVAVCPGEVARSRHLVERFLTLDAHAPDRQQTGTAGVPVSAIRLLTDSGDGAICSRLNTLMGSAAGVHGQWQWSYFAAGGRYFVALRRIESGTTRRLGFVPLLVLDGDLNQLGAFAM